jgi:hypothetical protein
MPLPAPIRVVPIVVCVSCALLMACGDDDASLAGADATATPEAIPLPAPAIAAIETAAIDLRVPLERVELVEYAPLDWPSPALGCPKRGKMYAQVITPGYRVLLRIDGREYAYHTDRTGRVARCWSHGQ